MLIFQIIASKDQCAAILKTQSQNTHGTENFEHESGVLPDLSDKLNSQDLHLNILVNVPWSLLMPLMLFEAYNFSFNINSLCRPTFD